MIPAREAAVPVAISARMCPRSTRSFPTLDSTSSGPLRR